MNDLPILSTIPRSGTWFLRYSIAFLSHLERGGRIDDRLTGRIVGDPLGTRFDFARFKGGPLFDMQGTLPAKRLFIGHTVCPGFTDAAGEFPWWGRTGFHMPGYDYLHEGLDYQYTPIELAPSPYSPVTVDRLERAARKGRGGRIALVYRNPIDQAASYYCYCRDHGDPSFNSLNGRPLGSLPFRQYLFDSALPSYAKQFVSFQAMAIRHPGLVRLVPYERLMAKPLDTMAELLAHLSGGRREWPALADALALARSKHLRAIEKELGRSLDGSRRGSHMWQGDGDRLEGWADSGTVSAAASFLSDRGINSDLFEWPDFGKGATAA